MFWDEQCQLSGKGAIESAIHLGHTGDAGIISAVRKFILAYFLPGLLLPTAFSPYACGSAAMNATKRYLDSEKNGSGVVESFCVFSKIHFQKLT